MLADIVAAIMVGRAQLMMEFRTPADAFRHVERSMTEGEGFFLSPYFRDFTTVVASSNYGAVENVTRELPDAPKVMPSRRADCARFKETAAALLNRRSGTDDEEMAAESAGTREAWGLIAAALGNKAKRGTFCAVLRAREPVPPGERSGDRAWPWRDAPSNICRQLDKPLKTRILPLWHSDRAQWIRMMKEVISRIGSRFHSQRMMRRYATEAYLR